jgi:hypothetical protein
LAERRCRLEIQTNELSGKELTATANDEVRIVGWYCNKVGGVCNQLCVWAEDVTDRAVNLRRSVEVGGELTDGKVDQLVQLGDILQVGIADEKGHLRGRHAAITRALTLGAYLELAVLSRFA